MRPTLPEKIEACRIKTGRLASTRNEGRNGGFIIQGPCGIELGIVASEAMPESEMWEHVSVSTPRRIPNWIEMCFVKDLFWEEEECVIQFHPPKSEYVNCHQFCLHLWKPPFAMPTPPSILVGPKG